ncbi:MAG: C10 family peptidase [Bacteroidales bacterium]|nr:C10 family peptidase [Bacteroidales bacterium]
MKKVHLTLLSLALAAVPAMASQLSPSQALAAAGVADSQIGAKMLQGAPLKLAYTATEQDINTCYIFNRGVNNGFLVLAADDEVTPILGYSEQGMIDPDNMPLPLKDYLEEIGREIAWAANNPGAVSPKAPSLDEPSIEPICKTLWDQDAPYNDMCPVVNGSTSVTGCAATAMAQVMKVQNWPVTGSGSNSYSWTVNSITYNISSDFSAHTYDWTNMLDSYTSSATTTQRNAVAQLMLDCGVAINMSYSPSASAAVSMTAVPAFYKYFGYGGTTHMAYRATYYLVDWNQLIYDELAAGRAVYLSGQNSEGGHAFVCDGYSSDNFFHINWGWSGISNGYFLLTTLDPTQQGIGGTTATDGYTGSLAAIIGLIPATSTTPVTPAIACLGKWNVQSSSYNRSSNITFGETGNASLFTNYSCGPVNGNLGVKLVNTSNNAITYVSATSSITDLQPRYGYYTYRCSASDFPTSGTYRVYPAFKSSTDSQWYDVRCAITGPEYLIAECSSDAIAFSTETGTVNGSDLQVMGEIYSGEKAIIHVKISTTMKEYLGTITPSLAIGTTSKYFGTSQSVDICEGEELDLTFITTFKSSSAVPYPTAGEYNLVVRSTNAIIAQIPVTVKENPGTLAYDTPTFKQIGSDTEFSIQSKAPTISPDNGIQVTIPVTSGYLLDYMSLSICNSSNTVYSKSAEQLVSSLAGNVVLDFGTEIYDGLNANTAYACLLTGQIVSKYNTIATRSPIWFKIDNSGIESLEVDQNGQLTGQYYNLQGMPVANPVKGQVYILRQGSTALKVMY